jgi:NAD-dependent SIR2 family protein deacetylase
MLNSLSLPFLLIRLLIFLGAGASVPLGIPTMNGFTEKEWENKILDIKSSLQSNAGIVGYLRIVQNIPDVQEHDSTKISLKSMLKMI